MKKVYALNLSAGELAVIATLVSDYKPNNLIEGVVMSEIQSKLTDLMMSIMEEEA